jgi:hypothetical protein
MSVPYGENKEEKEQGGKRESKSREMGKAYTREGVRELLDVRCPLRVKTNTAL